MGPLSCLNVCLSVCLTLVYCGQTVGWIKMPLGNRTEVGLGPVYSVRWRPSSPHGKGPAAPSPTFRPVYVVAKRSPISATAELNADNRNHNRTTVTIILVNLPPLPYITPSLFHSRLKTYLTDLSHHRLPSSLRTETTVHGLYDWTVSSEHLRFWATVCTRNPAIAEGPRDAGVPVEIW